MALEQIDARMLQHRLTTSGQQPLVAPSTDHLDGTWTAQHIYKGEVCVNLADGRMWMRFESGIREIFVLPSGLSSGDILYVSGSTLTRLPIGTSGDKLTVTGGRPAWSSGSASAQVNADWNAVSGVEEILNKPTLADVATSGAYSDLSGAPTLAAVATSNDYNDLDNLPAIPDAYTDAQAIAALKPTISQGSGVPDGFFDNTQGYVSGSRYIDTDTGVEYTCYNATTDDAIWKPSRGYLLLTLRVTQSSTDAPAFDVMINETAVTVDSGNYDGVGSYRFALSGGIAGSFSTSYRGVLVSAGMILGYVDAVIDGGTIRGYTNDTTGTPTDGLLTDTVLEFHIYTTE